MTDTLIVIPARLGSTRLPFKPIADIGGVTMIERVYKQATLANTGDVYVSCPDQDLYNFLCAANIPVIKTSNDIPTGSDRVYATYKILGKDYKYLINLQGDVPFIKPQTIRAAVETLRENATDISTLAFKITNPEELTDPNTVKVIIAANGNALYFTRASGVPHGDGDHFHHIGIYGYRADSLAKFISLPQSPLELRERLEQLRALENGMSISVGVVDDNPIGVDTMHDLEVVRSLLKSNE